MAGNRNIGGLVGVLSVIGLCCGMPLVLLLGAPAIVARILLSGAPNLASELTDWSFAALGSPLLALAMVRFVLPADGRLRRSAMGPRWLGILQRAGILLGMVNAAVLVQLTAEGSTEHAVSGGLFASCFPVMISVAYLVWVSVWDGRPEPVTVEEIRTAVADVDRTLRRVRAENDRVRRQAEQVQARLVKVRAAQPPSRKPAAKQGGKADEVDFTALRTLHRESYQCADTAHMVYHSTQTSLNTMSSIVRRVRFAPEQWVAVGRAAKLARAEMRAAATHIADRQGELRVQVDEGLRMVRTLNANTSELKHEIRDSCGRPGRQWFDALEQRIEAAAEERRASRTG